MSSDRGALGVAETARFFDRGGTAVEAATRAVERMTDPNACPGVWAHLDTVDLLRQAEALDREGMASGNRPPLAGAVAAVKDVFDVTGMPTRAGTRLTPDTAAASDAALVASLRGAGALIAGKTSMPEFSLGPTPGAVNPQDRKRTPGSSSAGSAMAAADRQVSVALGVQSNASVIRPAAFCGVYGFVPSRGILSMQGVQSLTPSLDAPGYLANSLEDITLVHQALAPGFTPCSTPPPLAWTRTPMWNKASAAMRDGIEKLAEKLGAVEVEVPAALADAFFGLEVVLTYELSDGLARLGVDEHELTPTVAEAAANGRRYGDIAYREALASRPGLVDLAARFLSPWGGVLAPAAPGAAPMLAAGSGLPLFSTMWSFVGAPAITLPLLSDDGMPLGIQLIGSPGADAGLLATAEVVVCRSCASQ